MFSTLHPPAPSSITASRLFLYACHISYFIDDEDELNEDDHPLRSGFSSRTVRSHRIALH